MINRRQFGLALVAGSAGTLVADDFAPSAPIGLLQYSYGRLLAAQKELANPVAFLAFARSRGASAVQMSLGKRTAEQATEVQRVAEKHQVALEGIVAPPRDDRADRDRFVAELQTARACGATIVRMVMLGGRRYEQFSRAEDYAAFAQQADAALRIAEPVARREKVVLAIENHKDFRADEQVDLLKRFGSEWLGVCLDTGNNLSLLEDPLTTARALAPWVRTVHLKDIGVEPAADGFRMAEVPLGQGMLDLKAIVAEVRRHQPRARLQLEMITRDPLSIPCLGDRYWATLGKVPGQDLARTLRLVQQQASKQPLPRMTGKGQADQLAVEDRHVRESLLFARENKWLSNAG